METSSSDACCGRLLVLDEVGVVGGEPVSDARHRVNDYHLTPVRGQHKPCGELVSQRLPMKLLRAPDTRTMMS